MIAREESGVSYAAKVKKFILNTGVPIIVYICVFAGMRYDPARPLVLGCLAGGLVGFWPSRLARKRNQVKFSDLSLILCAVAGALGGLLIALPLAGALVIISNRRARIRPAR